MDFETARRNEEKGFYRVEAFQAVKATGLRNVRLGNKGIFGSF
jgi:hypothetical protein